MVLRFKYSGFLFCLLATLAAAQAGAPSPDVNSIVQKMMAAHQENRARLHAFTVRRGYFLLDKKDQPRNEVVVNITLLPPDNKQYWIESSSGGGMGEKVLRDVLSKETEPVKDAQKKELSPENYDFQLLGEDSLDGRRCYLLGITPRREDKDLIRGKLWVDAQSYNVRRIEGSPVKSPSWWLHDVHILMSFAEVDGMWLRTFTQAVANVRFRGKYVLEARDLEYRTVSQTAARSRRNSGILAGAAINP